MCLYIDPNAQADIDAFKADPARENDAYLLEAFIERIAGLDDLSPILRQWPGEHVDPSFNTKGFSEQQRAGYNLYRLRPLTRRLWEYRILYAYDSEYEDIYILAVVIKRPEHLPAQSSERDFYNYEHDHPITQRIRNDYERYNFPRTH